MKLPFEKVKRKILVRKEEATSEQYGCKPEERSVTELINYGIVNLDKPPGPTSHQATDYVKKILDVKKAGHSGTLDPKVSGVLPVALGDATRIVQTLLPSGKEYVALMYLHKEVKENIIKKDLKKLVGKIQQTPPLKSSVKRVKREREVYYLKVLDIEKQHVLFRVGTEAGTYIRKLIHDFAKPFGGGHMVELRRTKAGPFTEENLVTLQDLEDAYWYWKNEKNEKYIRHCVQPMENAIAHLPKVWIRDSAVNSLTHGADLNVPGISKVESEIKKEDSVAVMSLKNELVGLGNATITSKDMLGRKGLAVKTHKIFMKNEVYPKIK